jgi:hypothetical protein
MNDYCIDLNLPISPLLPQVDFNSFSTAGWKLLNLNLINPEVNHIFEKLDLNLRIASMFVMTENSIGNIHIDGNTTSDRAKLNWVIGSEHTMNWYSIKNTTIQKLSNTRVSDNKNISSRYYVSYTSNEVELIHSQSVGYPSLIQSGIPHNITNLGGIRRCISIMLYNRLGNFLTMSGAKQIFSQYI